MDQPVAVEQLDAAVVARGVCDQRSSEVSERPGGDDPEQGQVALGDVEARKQHDRLAGDRDAGALQGHEHEHARQPGGVDQVRGGTDDWVEDRIGHAASALHSPECPAWMTGRRARTKAGDDLGAAICGPCAPADDGSRLRPPGAEVRSRRPALRRRLRAGLQPALPRCGGRHPRTLLDDAHRDDRLRGRRQGDRVQPPGAEPEVVALLPAPRPVAGRPRRCGDERAAGGGLHPGQALLLQHSEVGGRVRLPAHHRPGGRRPPREADDRRATRSRHPPPPHPRGAGGRRWLGRADGGAGAAPEPAPGSPCDRLLGRRPPQAGHARGRGEGAGLDGRDRRDPRSQGARRGDHRDPLGAGSAAREGRRGVPRARHHGTDAADRVRAAARRRPAHPPAARGEGRGRAGTGSGGDGVGTGRRLPGGQDRHGHGSRRVGRLGDLPADRSRAAEADRAARPRRGQPVPDRPRDARRVALHRGSRRCSPTARRASGCSR